MIITADTKMADIIHMNFYLISVIYRFGINLGFGDSTVNQICNKHDININFFLDIVNAFHDEEYFPDKHLQSFSIQLITDYLKKTHKFYLKVKIPEIKLLIENMIEKSYPDCSDVQLIIKFFNDYKIELNNHINREEELVFPYSLSIEEAYNQNFISPQLKDEMSRYSINDYKKEHNDIEVKLYDLKNIIIKYLPPPKDNYLCSKVIDQLYHLGKDLIDHERIENKVMVPKVIEMENSLRTLL